MGLCRFGVWKGSLLKWSVDEEGRELTWCGGREGSQDTRRYMYVHNRIVLFKEKDDSNGSVKHPAIDSSCLV